MDEHRIDAVVFPAVADVGAADMDVNEASADLGWRNGVWVAKGGLLPCHSVRSHRPTSHRTTTRPSPRPLDGAVDVPFSDGSDDKKASATPDRSSG